MDINMVMPTGPDSCNVIYDYFLEPNTISNMGNELEDFIKKSLAASDQVIQ